MTNEQFIEFAKLVRDEFAEPESNVIPFPKKETTAAEDANRIDANLEKIKCNIKAIIASEKVPYPVIF